MLQYDDKIVVVTGAAGGIGRAVAIEFATAGAIVVIADIQQEPQQATVSRIKDSGDRAYAYHCDVSDDRSVSDFRASVLQDIGVPDILYSNAVFARTGSISTVNLNHLKQEFDVNVLGYIRITQSFLPAMINRGSGWIANTALPNAFVPPPPVAEGMFGYCITKGAEASLTHCMAINLKEKGIGVSLLFPDVTATDSAINLAGNASDEWHTDFRKFIKSVGRPTDDVAKRLVQGLKEERYLVNTYPGFEKVLQTWVDKDLDPHCNYY
ncbi:hypothetical protein F66182_6070 [Fusarium sp. NRRL 66182]|nr:hypothetical protein F66182_6070 [Fusarium sp. NRRL 66182]